MFEQHLYNSLLYPDEFGLITDYIQRVKLKELHTPKVSHRLGFFNNVIYPDNNNEVISAAVVAIHNTITHTGADAGAEVWITNTYYRQLMYDLVALKWSEITQWRLDEFPYTVNPIAAIWISFRKANKHNAKPAIIEHLIAAGHLPKYPFPEKAVQYIIDKKDADD
jgi:hypothetical protein